MPAEDSGGVPVPSGDGLPPGRTTNGSPEDTRRRLRWLVAGVIAAGLAVVALGAAAASAEGAPPAWRLVSAGAVFLLGNVALLHIRFGHNQQSFTWSETALVLGLVLLPSPWVHVVVPVVVALSHLLAMRPAVKVLFNVMSTTTGVFLARVAFTLVPGATWQSPTRTVDWVALVVAALVFWAWTGFLVSSAVAWSQGLQARTVFRKGLLLNALVGVGNTALGLMLVVLAKMQPQMLVVVPGLLVVLYLVYWSYLRAMQDRDRWKVLQAASRELLRVESMELARVILERTPTLFGAEFVELVLVDGDPARWVSYHRWSGDGRVEHVHQAPVSAASAFWGRAVCEREAFTVDIRTAPANQRQDLEAHDLAKCVVAPLVVQDGCLGMLRIGFHGQVRFGSRELQIFTTFANHVSGAVHNSRLFEEMRAQALHDPLTGLANRTLFLDRLQLAQSRAARSHHGVAVMFLDLDRFKVVNDSLGHDAGDQLLVSVARRLAASLRPGDTAARFGGDEFVVLCEEVDSPGHALQIARRLVASLHAPFSLRDTEVYLTASMGVVVTPDSSQDPMALLRDADAAMYQAKARGPARVEMFDDEMRERAVARLATENDLRRAIERGELVVHYQPTVNLRSGRVTGVEALVRWHHPERGLVPPTDFVPLAEETGLIVPLGAWVLREACRQAALWQSLRRGGDEPLSVSVNLSPHQLASPDLVPEVARALLESDIRPSSLCLEITENALVDDREGGLETLHRLKALGVRLALDDFGTGYSSLNYLHTLPVDELKIDRSFVTRLGPQSRDRAIVAGLVDLAHALSLQVVAEGVEDAEQLADLVALECDSAQGYYLCPPEPAARIAGLLVPASRAAGAGPRGPVPGEANGNGHSEKRGIIWAAAVPAERDGLADLLDLRTS